MQGIYNYILETNHASTVYNVAAVLYLQFMLHEMLIKIQPEATVCRCLFTAKSLYMFWVSQHPSSGVLKTVTAASGTATSLQRGPIRPRWREIAVPEAAVTVFSTPDDGCCDTRNM